jgi:hypothetical protein
MQSKAPPFPKAESEGWATRKIKSKIGRSLRVGHPPGHLDSHARNSKIALSDENRSLDCDNLFTRTELDRFSL